MKVCPQCQNVYSDDTLNFCLDDGSVLTLEDSPTRDPQETLVMSGAKPTQFNQPYGTEQSFVNSPKYQPVSRGSSKTWLWVVGILVGLVVLCGGGVAGLAILGSLGDENFQSGNNSPNRENGSNVNADNGSSDDSRKLVRTSDFSDWIFDSNDSITASNKNGRLKLTSRDGFYYTFVFKEFKTYNASTKVTVESQTGRSTAYGYGLVVNSHPTNVLSKDYAFLIDAQTGQYRIAKHINKEESEIVKWTPSSAIKTGSAENDIEVRISESDMKLYINGKYVRTVEDTTGYQDGVAGVYTSDEVAVTFTNLELRK